MLTPVLSPLLTAALVLVTTAALAAPPTYPWLAAKPTRLLSQAVSPPPGFARIPAGDGSFARWLRNLPLRPAGTAVMLHDGRQKPNQSAHAHVVDIDTGRRDLQQCADAAMRLRAEYLWAAGRRGKLGFHFTNGKWTPLRGASRRAFKRWFLKIMVYSGTASLQRHDTRARAVDAVQPGDLLIQGGFPGHAVLVLDVAASAEGKRLLLLGQSYMPAQDFHVLKNPTDSRLSPWYRAEDLQSTRGLRTPEWRPFRAKDLRRFR